MKLLITSFRKTTILAAAALVVVMNAFAFAASGTWAPTGAMISARDGHTSTLLTNGKVVMQDLSLSGLSGSRGFPIEFSLRGPDWDKLADRDGFDGLVRRARWATFVRRASRS